VRRLPFILPYALALLVSAACAGPLLHFLFDQTNLATQYGENLGFRYFLSMRLLEGAEDYVFNTQGPLFPLIQHVLYLLVSTLGSAPAAALPLKINAFGYATHIAGIIVLLASLVYAASRSRIPILTRCVLISLPLFYSYAFTIGFAYLLYPDYNFFGQACFVVVTTQLYELAGQGAAASTRQLWLLGAMIALAGSLKSTYVVFPAVYALAYLWIRSGDRLRAALHLASATAASWLVVALLYFHGSPRNVLRYLGDSVEFGRRLTGDPEFSKALLQAFSSSWSDNSLLIYWEATAVAVLVVAVALLSLRDAPVEEKRSRLGLAVAGLACIAIYSYGMFARGGGASFQDSVYVMLPAAVISAHQISSARLRQSINVAIAVFTLGLPLAWASVHLDRVVSNLGIIAGARESDRLAGGRWHEQIHSWNVSHGRPVILLMPSNDFVVGSVEDMMMRGFSDWNSHWYTANLNRTRKMLFPNFWFADYNSTRGTDYAGSPGTRVVFPESYVFMWTEPSASNRSFPAELSARHHAYLAEQGYLKLVGTPLCRTWEHSHWKMRIHSCRVDTSVVPQ
jgi:hypothetical protein